MESIKITKTDLKNINYDDIMFVSFAEPGAMGAPGTVEILLKNTMLYETNYCYSKDVKMKDLISIFPPFETFCCGVGIVTNLDKKWKWLDMGMGNYLLVRKTIIKKFLSSLYEEIAIYQEITPGVIYKSWKEIACRILRENQKSYIFLSVHYEDDDIPNRTYYYMSYSEDIKKGDRVLVDRNDYKTVGIVEKVEIFKKNKVPFPIERTKYIIKKVDDYYVMPDLYDEVELYEQKLKIYNQMFLKNMFNRLSIKRLMNLMFIQKKYANQQLNGKLLYVPRMNLFFYKYEKYCTLAESELEVLDNEVFRILEREAIEVPRKFCKNTYTQDNYKKAILFCRKNYLTIHDDTDILDFAEAKRKLYTHKEEKVEKKKINKIEEIIEYLKQYKSATYKLPNPNYYIDGNKIIHYCSWLDYDDEIFDLYAFLRKKKYINESRVFEIFKENQKKWEDWENWNVDELDYEKANYLIVRLYNRERICEGIINEYAKNGKLLKIVEKLLKK